ncbi:class I SAM-dependent methyltransferase [Comamonadaceae bacterium M7527]|nr:class I SAM-dependent methyltransferase [Comamonadaceae bacterium M7527]
MLLKQTQFTWDESGQTHTALWRAAISPPPAALEVADDTLSADKAYKLLKGGAYLLWRGDYHNGRQLLQALGRRLDKKPRVNTPKANQAAATADQTAHAHAAFVQHRADQARRHNLLARVLLAFEPDYSLALRRAPKAQLALTEAWGEPTDQACIASFKDLQGMIGAHEWRKKGVGIPFLDGCIHPHYAVYSPLRGEYIDLVATAPLPPGAQALAFDIGTGSGVIAAVLAKRGVQRVLATDMEPRAIACATDNLQRLGLSGQVDLVATNLFPQGQAPLIVCNPPWLPAPANNAIERAVYDPDSAMLRGFLGGLGEHLTPGGEGWLILSDLAEHLGLRTRDELMGWIAGAGLRVVKRHDTRPTHPKSKDAADPLFMARRKEVTSLWRLARKA